MKLKQLLEQLNQLAKERPEALEMEVLHYGQDFCKMEICGYKIPKGLPKVIILMSIKQ